MPSAERPSHLINPYASEPDPVEESAGPGRVAGRALVIGTLGIGAAAALTGTGFAYEPGSDGSGSSDFSSFDPTLFGVSSAGSSLPSSSSSGSGSGDTGSVDFSSGEQLSYAAPVEQIVAAKPVEPVEPVEPSRDSDVLVKPELLEPLSSDSRETGTSAIDAGSSNQVSYVPSPEPLWGFLAPDLPDDPEKMLSYPDAPTFPEFPDTPEEPGSDVPVEPVAPVVPPLWQSDPPVEPSSNLTLQQRSLPDTSRDSSIEADRVPGHLFDLAPDTSSSEPTGVPASPLIMPTAMPITTFLLPGYQGDAEVSTPSFTDRSQRTWVDNLRAVDTNPGSHTFGRVVPRSDNARSMNDLQSRDVPGRTLSPYLLSTPYQVPPTSGPMAPPTPVPLSESLNLDRVGASEANFGTSDTSLADTLQIRSGGPSSDDMFFSTASSRLPGLQDGGMLVASSAVSDSGGLSSANGSPALVTPDSGRPFTLTPEGELYASETVGSPRRPIPLRDVKRPSSTLQVVPPFKEFICGVAEWVCAPSSVQHNPPGTIIMIPVGAPGSPRQPVLTDKDTYKLCWTSKHDCAVYEPHGKGQLMQKIEGAHGTPHYLPSGQVPRRLRP